MAHPIRKRYAERLARKVGCRIQYDPVDIPSQHPEQRWANGREAWLRLAKRGKAEWSMVVQDDAITSKKAITNLGKGLDYITEECIVSPYLGSKKPAQGWYQTAIQDAKELDAKWIVGKSLSWGVAIAVPTWTINDMLDWCDSKINVSYDKRIGLYYRDVMKWYTYYPWPSLVDHRLIPSLCGHDTEGRKAHKAITNGATVTWNNTLAYDPRVRPRV